MKKKYSGKLCLGYRCWCGEKVTVLRVRAGAPVAVQRDIMATCPKGHTSTVKADALILMDSEDEGRTTNG